MSILRPLEQILNEIDAEIVRNSSLYFCDLIKGFRFNRAFGTKYCQHERRKSVRRAKGYTSIGPKLTDLQHSPAQIYRWYSASQVS